MKGNDRYLCSDLFVENKLAILFDLSYKWGSDVQFWKFEDFFYQSWIHDFEMTNYEKCLYLSHSKMLLTNDKSCHMYIVMVTNK